LRLPSIPIIHEDHQGTKPAGRSMVRNGQTFPPPPSLPTTDGATQPYSSSRKPSSRLRKFQLGYFFGPTLRSPIPFKISETSEIIVGLVGNPLTRRPPSSCFHAVSVIAPILSITLR